MKTTIVILITLLGLSTTAEAQPHRFAQRDRIKYLAQELSETAHYAHQTIEGRAYYGYGRSRALEALHRLDRQARRFNRIVHRHHRQSHRAKKAYRQLTRSYWQARRALRHSGTLRPVRHDMRRIGRLLDRIAYAYDGYGPYYGNDPYYDNDHYRGDDYDHGYHGKKGRNGKKGRHGPPLRAPRGSTPGR